MRVDKWIWATRMVKSRTLAADLCRRGKVLVNDQTCKPSHKIKLQDMIAVDTGARQLLYCVLGFVEKRVGAEAAKEFFSDHSPEPAVRPARIGIREKGSGRPTKKDRRAMKKFFG